jgi:diadenosine tetraphosphate (Ap4A) HIT family hydrolase
VSLISSLVQAGAEEAVKLAADWTVDRSKSRETPLKCVLCDEAEEVGVRLVARSRDWRVVRVVDNEDHPAFWRVIWNDHAAEMTDLAPEQRSALMQAVCKVEAVVRRELQPHKINLASLGNVVPHLHWHVIARWRDDPHFPQAIWGTRLRDSAQAQQMRLEVQLPQVDRALQAELMRR